MNEIYKDIIEKIEYHKKKIYEFYIKNNYYPSKELVEDKLSSIDNRISLFKKIVAIPGDKLDINKINYCIQNIYIDLTILFKVLNDITVKEYNSLLLYVESHLTELEQLSNELSQRTKEEMNSTTFGTTIYFKSGNWNLSTKDETDIIDLGEIELIQDSKIACFANIDNISKEDTNIKFIFKATDSKYDLKCLPYNYNNNSYRVPGESSKRDSIINIKDTIKMGETVKLNNGDNGINNDNDYKILASVGKMKITNKETGVSVYQEIPTRDNPYMCPVDCYITMYSKDIDILEYNFNFKPLHTNFSLSDGYIRTKKDIDKIYIDAQKDFVFYIEYESEAGLLYANLEDGIIEGKYLIYKNNISSNDYCIREYIKTNKTRYTASIEIESKEDTGLMLNNIYIKEVD